ncbi:MAG: type II secretion system F family protein [Anaerosomatales bacterium]|nr:type II secretion system F family protein [Anaerosomatales bacterium]MDT8434289.1 type II secretion system F family protein [Anaerosomatales bacterium]
MLVLSAAVAGLAVGVVIYSLLALVFSEESLVARRLKRLNEYERVQAAEIEPLALPFVERVMRPIGDSVRRGVHLLAPGDYRARIAERLQKGGNPRGLDADAFLALKIFLSVVIGLATGVGFSVSGRPAFHTLLAGVIAFAVGFFLPDLWLRSRTTARQNSIRRALPDMLDMLTISVEAGLGFDASLTKYLRNSTGPLAEEFSKVLNDINAGLSRRDALRNLSERAQVPELTTFAMAMVQADVFGISVSKVLHTQSKEMRTKRRQFAEETAQKAPAKMVFPLILFILPATLIVLMGPAVISIGRAFGLLAP